MMTDNLPAVVPPGQIAERAVDGVNMDENAKNLVKGRMAITREDFYPIRKKVEGRWVDVQEPGSRVINAMAQAAGIKTKVIDCGKNDNQAWAHVAAWVGDEKDPLHYLEEKVIHDFRSIQRDLAIKAVKNGIWLYDESMGRKIKHIPDFSIDMSTRDIIFTETKVQLHLLSLMSDKIIFSERDAQTKALRRVNFRLLGIEHREAPEISHEIDEVKLLDEGAKENQENEAAKQAGTKSTKPPTIVTSAETLSEMASVCKAIGLGGADSKALIKALHGTDDLTAQDRPDFMEFIVTIRDSGHTWEEAKRMLKDFFGEDTFTPAYRNALITNLKKVIAGDAVIEEDEEGKMIMRQEEAGA
jgi:hypothetical protein